AISDTTVIASANAPTTATFTVDLLTPSSAPVTVSYATTDGTALAGVDYVAASGTLTFAPGETEQTIKVTVNPAPGGGFVKTFDLNLFNPTAPTTPFAQPTATIFNPNPLPTVTIDGTTVGASRNAPTTAAFTVRLSAPANGPVTLSYATA